MPTSFGFSGGLGFSFGLARFPELAIGLLAGLVFLDLGTELGNPAIDLFRVYLLFTPESASPEHMRSDRRVKLAQCRKGLRRIRAARAIAPNVTGGVPPNKLATFGINGGVLNRPGALCRRRVDRGH